MLKASRKAKKIKEKKNIYTVRQMLAYLGWLSATNTYEFYLKYIKPYVNFGKLKKYVSKYDLRITDCYVIGDMGKNEIVMAHNAGCKGILVLTGGGKASLGEFRHTWIGHDADLIADNAFDAVKMIIL